MLPDRHETMSLKKIHATFDIFSVPSRASANYRPPAVIAAF
jgi:hypothetical protein